MTDIWEKDDIEKILIRMNELNLPFKGYSFDASDSGLVMLGKGSSSYVFRAHKNRKEKVHYAVKVIGFNGNKPIKDSFEKAVSTQKSLSYKCDNVVRIIDHTDVIVKIDGVNTVASAEEYLEESEPVTGDNELYLQFILMEEVIPVVKSAGPGRIRLSVDKLNYDTGELLRLASDIGTALREAHKLNTLHRDVKLENVFYSPASNLYKLGDFGIAKSSPDLQADTKAFTKGYGAPEVVFSPEDKYDNTADIYSFGIMLYILLNGCRFPDSKNYHSNLSVQYCNGYTPPAPSMGSKELIRVVLKMCSYNPDERYQSVDEILVELDSLIYGKHLRFLRRHKSASLAMGFVTWLLGAFIWKLSFNPSWNISVSFGLIAIIFLSVSKYVFTGIKKEKYGFDLLIIVLGAYLLIRYGFSWQRLIMLLIVLIFDEIAGWLSMGLLVMILAEKFDAYYCVTNSYDLKWMAITLLSISVFMLIRFFVSEASDKTILETYGKKYILSAYPILGYIGLLLSWKLAVTRPERAQVLFGWLFGNNIPQRILECRFDLAGIAGLIFCFVWTGREMVIRIAGKIREEKMKTEV